MNRFPSKRSVFLLIVLLLVLLFVTDWKMRPQLVPGQTPLTNISSIETLRAQFNKDNGKTRLIILVSPT